MIEIHFLPVIVAAVVAFFASFIWYLVFAKQMVLLGSRAVGKPEPILIGGELVKNILLAVTLAYIAYHIGVHTMAGVIHVSLLLWVTFPVLILISSVMYEKVPVKLAAIHAGDWLVKLLVILVITGLW